MTPEPRTPAILQFGVFEVDLHARELYKQGVRLKLQEQPFRVLTVLLQRFGEVVSREELRAQIWPEDTFVDFDANLNTSINKLREALGDSAENPRFIETLPRRGYRFITPVTAGVGTAKAPIAKASAGVPAGGLKIAPPISRSRMLPWIIAAAAVLVAAAVGLGRWRSNPPVEQPLVRLDVDLGAQITLPAPAINGSSVIISPDGTRLVFVASVAGGRPKLFTRKLDQPNVTELSGTEEASAPFFSADGQSVGFSANNKVNRISVKGGEVVPLMDVAYFVGGSWSEDGNIIVGRAMKEGMARISSSGGAPSALTELASGEGFHGSPQLLPGAKAVLFMAGAIGNPDKNTIDIVSLADRRRKSVLRGAGFARYLPSGHLVYVRKGTLFAIPFDLARLEARGTAVPVLDQIAHNTITDAAQFDLSLNGTLVYRRAGGAPRKSTVQWLEATGKKEPLLAKPGEYKEPRLSPDGKRLVLVVVEGGRHDIWVYDWQRDTMTRLTFDGGPYGDPTWTPDGRYVVFDSYQGGIYWTHADGATQPQPLTQSKTFQVPVSFTPDGKRLAYHETSSSGVNQIWTVPVENSRGRLRADKPEQFLNGQFSQGFAEFSPDGRWLAYVGDESGKYEVYVRAFPVPASGQSGKWQISNFGGQVPRWSRNGHELLYYASDQIMTVRYSAKGNTFLVDKPQQWGANAAGTHAAGCDNCFDVSPDVKRVAVLTPVETEPPRQEHEIVFLFNFFDELRRRVPTGK